MANKLDKKKKIKFRIRKKVAGNAIRPRLTVFRSNKEIYCQVVNDDNGSTILSASSKEVKVSGSKKNVSEEVGKLLAKKAIDNNINEVVFDRNGYLYHGRVKALADGARSAGLKL